ncbi:MAG: flavodoxin [Massilimicrobiota timonensis]
MKKILTLLLVGIFVLGILTGCQSNNETTQTNEQPQKTETSNQSGKTLVVYYSATGNTKAVAEMIAEETNGDLFEIEPKDSYSEDDLDWTDSNSRVAREYENEDERHMELVSSTVDNWEDYDTVFLGYPIWWGIAAWPVNTFIENNDFTDKTVVPFCTSASSGLGQSGELLAKEAGDGDWQEGQRFSSSTSNSEVQEWLNELGIIE